MTALNRSDEALVLYGHLLEVCRFIESVTETTCSGIDDFFCHGVHLALLANKIAPQYCTVSKIYDKTLARYEGAGYLPSFRHLDNINIFIDVLDHIGVPKVFHPECRDVYERRNLPQLVYCLSIVQNMMKCEVTSHTVNCPQDILFRIIDCIKGCKMPHFDRIDEVVQNFKRGISSKENNKPFTTMKSYKMNPFSKIGKENITPNEITEAFHSPNYIAAKFSPRKEERRILSPISTPSQIICKLNNKSQSARWQLGVRGESPLSELKDNRNTPSNVQDWIKQQRMLKSSAKGTKKQLFDGGMNSGSACDSKTLDGINDGVYPIQDDSEKKLPNSESDELYSDCKEQNLLTKDCIPPPLSFSTGSTFAMEVFDNLPSLVKNINQQLKPYPEVPLCPPQEFSHPNHYSDVINFDEPRKKSSRLSISVPTSPCRTADAMDSCNAFSFDDLSVVVRNLTDARRCPSASSLTVVDADIYQPNTLQWQANESNLTLKEMDSEINVTINESLHRLHSSLQNGSPSSTFIALQALKAQYPLLPSLVPHATALYHVEMTEAMIDAQGCLSLEEVCGGVMLVKAVAAINSAVSAYSDKLLMKALTDNTAHLQDVSPKLIKEYLAHMQVALNQLAAVNATTDDPHAVDTTLCPMLTYLHIQQIIDQVNTADEDKISQLGENDQHDDTHRLATLIPAPATFSSDSSSVDIVPRMPPTSKPLSSYSTSQNKVECSTAERRSLSRTLSSRLLQHTNSFSTDIFTSLSTALESLPAETSQNEMYECDPLDKPSIESSISLDCGSSVMNYENMHELTSSESFFSEQSKVLSQHEIYGSLQGKHINSSTFRNAVNDGLCSPLKPDEKYSQVSFHRGFASSHPHTNYIHPPVSHQQNALCNNQNFASPTADTRHSRSQMLSQSTSNSHLIYGFEPEDVKANQTVYRRRSRSQGEVEQPQHEDHHAEVRTATLRRRNTAECLFINKEHEYVNVKPSNYLNGGNCSTVEPLYQTMSNSNQFNGQFPNNASEDTNLIYSTSQNVNSVSSPPKNSYSIYETIDKCLQVNSTPSRANIVQMPTITSSPNIAPNQQMVNDVIYSVVQKKPKASASDLSSPREIPRANVSLQSLLGSSCLDSPSTHINMSQRKQSVSSLARIVSFYNRGCANNYQRWIWEKAALRIQHWWKIHVSLRRLENYLKEVNEAPESKRRSFLSLLTPCLPLLPLTHADLSTEKRLQIVKADLSRCLKSTALYQQQVDQLDVQIGLLLTNTINIQENTLHHLTDMTGCMNEEVLAPLGCVLSTPTRKGPSHKVTPNNKATPSIKGTPTKRGTPRQSGTPGSNKGTPSKKSQTTDRKGTLINSSGLKALRKCSRDRLKGYQHLFYLLQTEPKYLATLIFALPSAKTTRFVEGVVFALFNYGANDRDNFLLINLFKTALEEEIRCKVLRISDVVSGDPLVVKMIVSFVRKGPGRAALRDILGTLVTEVLEDTQLNLNTNPVEIYQTWLNEIEMHTGKSSGSPYHITAEDALKHPEVVSRLNSSLGVLTRLTTRFCTAICQSIHKLPYALLYLSGVMRKALAKRFPHIMDKEILKVVGNLIYYRYINSGIVAPDAFDVITIGPGEQLTSRQRRNLATIAKTLQAAATKRGFGTDTPHLCSLNPELVTWHEKLRGFFSGCCRVPCPEAVFAVTAYSEVALIHQPQIQMTLQEVHDTHVLILNHLELLAPSASDILHDILDDLSPPDLMELGDPSGKAEMTLSLYNKYANVLDSPANLSAIESKSHQESEVAVFGEASKVLLRSQWSGNAKEAKLLEKSKQHLVEVLLCYPLIEDNTRPNDKNDEVVKSRIKALSTVNWDRVSLTDVISCSTNIVQEQRYEKLKAGDCTDSLHAIKTRLSHNLRRLENLGIASPKNNYSGLLESVAQDVLNQKQYRQKRGQELARLSVALVQMKQKESFMCGQRDSYLTYLTTCKSHLMEHCSKKLRRGGSSSGSLTYTGKRLKEKGILLNIRDFTLSQYSSVAFVICRVETVATKQTGDNKKKSNEVEQNCSNTSQSHYSSSAGVFSVTVKYRGLVVENMKVTIQELLQLQYEGVRVKEIAGAQINVNLLLHLLNTKFFVRKK